MPSEPESKEYHIKFNAVELKIIGVMRGQVAGCWFTINELADKIQAAWETTDKNLRLLYQKGYLVMGKKNDRIYWRLYGDVDSMQCANCHKELTIEEFDKHTRAGTFQCPDCGCNESLSEETLVFLKKHRKEEKDPEDPAEKPTFTELQKRIIRLLYIARRALTTKQISGKLKISWYLTNNALMDLHDWGYANAGKMTNRTYWWLVTEDEWNKQQEQLKVS